MRSCRGSRSEKMGADVILFQANVRSGCDAWGKPRRVCNGAGTVPVFQVISGVSREDAARDLHGRPVLLLTEPVGLSIEVSKPDGVRNWSEAVGV